MKTSLFFLVLWITAVTLKAQTVTTVSNGSFSDGLALDAEGNIYGSDFGGDSVYKYGTDGSVTVFKDGFTSPNGIALDVQGNIYICDHFANIIYKYDPSGTELETYTDVITPAGIKRIPGTNDMLIVGYSSNTINILDNDDGSITEIFADGILNGPAGIAFVNGQTFVANFNDRKILRLENGELTQITQLPASASQSNFLGFLTSFNGALYATQIGECKIYRIDPDTGAFDVFAGSVLGNDDGSLDDARFNLPNGILGDETRNRIYISDAGSKNLRIIQDIPLGLGPENDLIEVSIAPNPARDLISLTSKATVSEVTIYDIQMKRIIELRGNNITQIATDRLAAGSYWIKITTGEGLTSFKKLLIH